MRGSEINRTIIIEYLTRRSAALAQPAPHPEQSLSAWFRKNPAEAPSFLAYIAKEFGVEESKMDAEIVLRSSPAQIVFYLARFTA